MILPEGARARLTEPYRARLSQRSWDVGQRGHTVPIEPAVWARYGHAVARLVRDLDAALAPSLFDPESGFENLRRTLGCAADARDELVAVLQALSPFKPFDPALVRDLVRSTDDSMTSTLDAVLDARIPHHPAPDEAEVRRWKTDSGTQPGHALRETFAMSVDPIDDAGDFSPSRVFEAYKYNGGGLLQVVMPHLESLSLEPVDDLLTLVCACGWIAGSPDPVKSYTAMLSTAGRLLAASETATGQSVIDSAFARLDARDEALRQSRRRAAAELTAAQTEQDMEAQAHLRADAYKRLVEGPVREHVWIMRSLRVGTWTPPPTLGPLKEVVVADANWLSMTAAPILLTDIRNAQAHEALVWDGRRGVYVVDDATVDPAQLAFATVGAAALARGCEVALAHHQARSAAPVAAVPVAGEAGRMQGWRRAEAFLGTNGLRVDFFGFNSNSVLLRLERFDDEDINPCFAALLLANRLLPGLDAFDVRGRDGEQLLHVDREALDRTDPVWEQALTFFDALPLSAFLPANFNARRRLESESVAIRSAAWIGADDVLGAIDGASWNWDGTSLDLVSKRVKVASAALEACMGPLAAPGRLRMLGDAVRRLDHDLAGLRASATYEDIDQFPSTRRIRGMWEAWGPVPRLPNVTTRRPPEQTETDYQPAHRPPGIPRWSSM